MKSSSRKSSLVLTKKLAIVSLTQGSLGIDLPYITYYLYHVQWAEIDPDKQNSVELITTSCFGEIYRHTEWIQDNPSKTHHIGCNSQNFENPMLVVTYLNLKFARVHLNLKELIVFVCGYCEKHSFSGIFEKNHYLHRVL